jgi:hypothetical protein
MTIDHALDETLMQPRFFFPAALGLVILLIVMGCNYNQRLKVNRLPPLPEHDKIPLRVVLLLRDEMCDFTYKVNKSRSMRTWVYRMGKTLCAYSEAVARDVFTEVEVVALANEAAARVLAGKADVAIVPRVLGVLVYFPDFPQSIWEKQEVEIILDWLLMNAEEQVIWAKTYGYADEERAGSFLTRAHLNRKAMQTAIDEVFVQIRDDLLSSPEIRDLVVTRR